MLIKILNLDWMPKTVCVFYENYNINFMLFELNYIID